MDRSHHQSAISQPSHVDGAALNTIDIDRGCDESHSKGQVYREPLNKGLK